jgi:hypothetical protein
MTPVAGGTGSSAFFGRKIVTRPAGMPDKSWIG